MDKMTTCKVCGASIAKSATTCPQCGAKQKKRHPVLGIIIAIFGICMIAAGCLLTLAAGRGAALPCTRAAAAVARATA